jgi:hypothetical protein
MLFKIPSQIRELKEYLYQLQGEWTVTIEKPKRSKIQNATYWNNIEILAKYSGHTNDEMSAIVKN